MKRYYWLIDVRAGCRSGYSFAVTTEIPEGADEYNYRDAVAEGAKRAGLFEEDSDCYGAAVHEFGEVGCDWYGDAHEIVIE